MMQRAMSLICPLILIISLRIKWVKTECIKGLERVEMYIEDPIMIAEMTVYLEQNFCLSDWEDCKTLVVEHFPAMHTMAMEKFFIPTEICYQEPVCGADPPTRPPFMSGN